MRILSAHFFLFFFAKTGPKMSAWAPQKAKKQKANNGAEHRVKKGYASTAATRKK